MNHKRVERIWRREGLKVPRGQPKRGRLWLSDGSCMRLRPLRPNHVWAYDFVATRTHNGRGVRLLTIMDEYTRECLAIRVGRNIRSSDVIERPDGRLPVEYRGGLIATQEALPCPGLPDVLGNRRS